MTEDSSDLAAENAIQKRREQVNGVSSRRGGGRVSRNPVAMLEKSESLDLWRTVQSAVDEYLLSKGYAMQNNEVFYIEDYIASVVYNIPREEHTFEVIVVFTVQIVEHVRLAADIVSVLYRGTPPRVRTRCSCSKTGVNCSTSSQKR